MQSVWLIVTRRPEYVAGDRFEVYGDGGSGAIDFANALSDRPIPFWREAPPREGHLLDGHLVLQHLDSVQPDRHLSGLHLTDEHLRPAAALVFETRGYHFGAFKHAIKVFDAWGNVSQDEPVEVTTVINSSPRAPADFNRHEYDAQMDQVAFSFAKSLDLG